MRRYLAGIKHFQTDETAERKLLLLDDKGNVRESQQIIGLLSRRIDCKISHQHLLTTFSFASDVRQNIRTISSLLSTAQGKCAATTVLSKPNVRNEESLPLTEIHEELDEEGNIICRSSMTSRLSFS